MRELFGERAVVVGGGMAGLLAARVLADRYAQVTVVDRDDLPPTAVARRGVPQAHHAHALLARGQQVLEDLFPGLTADLAAAGAETGDVVGDSRMYLSGHRLRPTCSGLVAISTSRPLLESQVRARVRALPSVRIEERCDAVGLARAGDAGALTGVRILRRADHSAEEVLAADVVIDASGRTSRAPSWLQALGIRGPEEERLALDVVYATRRYRLGRDVLGGDLAVLHGLTRDHPRGGVLAIIGKDEAMLTLAGVLGDRPPRDPGGFDAFAASLRFPDIHHAIRGAEPLDDPVPYRFPASVWRHYERLPDLPDGFAVMGDGICNFNPVYGQGMTIAALQAVALRRHLERHRRVRARRFARELAKVVRPPWQMATGADLLFPGVERRRTGTQRLLGNYVTRIHATAAHDPDVARAFVRVSGLVDGPQALLRPSTVWRVLGPGQPPTARPSPSEAPAAASTPPWRSRR